MNWLQSKTKRLGNKLQRKKGAATPERPATPGATTTATPSVSTEAAANATTVEPVTQEVHFPTMPPPSPPEKTMARETLARSDSPGISTSANSVDAKDRASIVAVPSVKAEKEEPTTRSKDTTAGPSDRSKGSTIWAGTKTVLQLVDQTVAEAFSPLKATTSALLALIDICEKAAENRREFEDLNRQIKYLAQVLQQHSQKPLNPSAIERISALNSELEELVATLEARENDGLLARTANATRDQGEIQEMKAKMADFLNIFIVETTLSIEVSATVLEDIGKKTLTLQLLDKLEHVVEAQYDATISVSRRGCTPGTRVRVLAELIGWALDEKGSKIYWMNGMAGTGKTTIAYSFCEALKRLGLLGATFFCSRSSAKCSAVERIPPTLAYQLALRSQPFMDALADVLTQNNGEPGQNISVRFERVVVQPLKAANIDDLQMVVLVDALDECSNPQHVEELLSNLWKYADKLPIKIFVTSRPESHLHGRIYSRDKLSRKFHLHRVEESFVQHDIRLFIQERLHDFLVEGSKLQSLVERLVKKSGGLFIYTATACRYILEGPEDDESRQERIQSIVREGPSEEGETEEIDHLYETILNASVKRHRTKREKKCLGIILQSLAHINTPLNVDDLAELLKLTEKQIRGHLSQLHSVVSMPEDKGLVRTLHASFPDFLRNSNYLVKACECQGTDFHHLLVESSFQIMNEELHFNICKFPSSHLANSDLGPAHFIEAIRSALSYACQFWGSHLAQLPGSPLLISGKSVQVFVRQKLLYWLEALSGIRAVTIAADSLSTLIAHLSAKKPSGENIVILKDAIKFIRYFAGPISYSAPHLYISALPFSPVVSRFASMQKPSFEKSMALQLGALEDWPSELMVISGHRSFVHQAIFSPDEKYIASCSSDNTIRIWDIQTGESVIGPFEHPSDVFCISFSPDGKYLASGSKDNAVRIWEVESAETIMDPFIGHSDPVRSVAFSPDGKYVASGSDDYTIRIWDDKTGDTIMGPFEHSECVRCVSFSPDGKLLGSGSGDKTVCIWDLDTGEKDAELHHSHYVMSVAFSPDGEYIVSGTTDYKIHVWDLNTGDNTGVLSGHSGGVTSVIFSADGNRILSSSDDSTIRVWDIETGKTISGPFSGHTSCAYSVASSRDGKYIVSASDDSTIRIWDGLAGESENKSFAHADTVKSVAFSPNGKYLASGSSDNTIRLWDFELGTMIRLLEGHCHMVASVAFSPDGNHLASSSRDGEIRIWDVQTGETAPWPFKDVGDDVHSVVFSPDGMLLASGAGDGLVHIWDAKTGKAAARPFEGHSEAEVEDEVCEVPPSLSERELAARAVNCVAFSPDGTSIASASDDETINIWSVESGNIIAGPLQGHSGAVLSVAFSPDGKRIASGSEEGNVSIWDVETGEIVVGPLGEHADFVRSVAFTPDGKRLASCSDDRKIFIWDSETGEVVSGPLEGHTSMVMSIAISPDGKYLASGSNDFTIRVWDLSKLDNNQSPFNYRSRIDGDGWVKLSDGGLLFWVPNRHRRDLLRPGNVRIITSQETHLDLSQFVHGKDWTSCYTP